MFKFEWRDLGSGLKFKPFIKIINTLTLWLTTPRAKFPKICRALAASEPADDWQDSDRPAQSEGQVLNLKPITT